MKKYYCVITLILGLTQVHAQRFVKITAGSLGTTPGDSRSVNWIDVNGDGFVDCFVSNGPQAGQNNMLYLNNQHGQFIAVTDDPIVQDDMPSDGATFADVDNDGDLDAFVVNWYNINNLAYLNNGDGTFMEITGGPWVSQGGFSETASFGDYDNDGLVDVYVTNSDGNKRNFLYHNAGGAIMEPVTTGAPVTDASTSRNASWVDIDSDGDSDLFVTNENSERNQVYRNDGNGVFVRLADVAITTSFVSTMSSCWGDTDNDGDLDVFLANDGSKNQYFRNDGGFVFTPLLNTDISLYTANAFGCAWADIDNDADLDLFVTNAFKSGTRLKNQLYLNDGTGHLAQDTTEVVTKDLGWSYGCAFGDYNNNGFMDLAVATTRFGGVDEPDYLYYNVPNNNRFLMIGLEGVESNRSAIGAIVRVKATIGGDVVWQMRDVSAQSGYCGQNDLRVHFGLGLATSADSVIIEWPSGNIEFMTQVSAGQILDIKESIVNAVPELENTFGLTVFPNPAQSSLTIRADFRESVSHVRYEIVDDTGRVVHHEAVQRINGIWEATISLNSLKLASGTYYVRLYDRHTESTCKFVYAGE